MLYDLRSRIDVPPNVDPNNIRDATSQFLTGRGATVVAIQVARTTRKWRVLTVNVNTRAVQSMDVEAATSDEAKSQVEGSDPNLVAAEIT